jgi:hypothetical protein
MQMTITKALNAYFNKGEDGKSIIAPSEFLKELKALSPDEKHEMASLACIAEDRIHRISNPRTCMYYYLRTLACIAEGWELVDTNNKPLALHGASA